MAGWFRTWKDTLTDPYLLAAADELHDDYGACLTFTHMDGPYFSSGTDLEGQENRNALLLLLRGAMVTLWAYADDHIEDDNSLPMSAFSLDRLVGLEGFHKIVPAKWLQIDEANRRVILPGFREKNALETKTKKREANAERQRRFREKHRDDVTDERNADSNADRNAKSNARNAPKTKTKTNTKKEDSGTPDSFDLSGLPDDLTPSVWADFLKARKTIRKPISTQTAVDRVAASLHRCKAAGFSPDYALGEAIERGWQSVKIEWLQNTTGGKPAPAHAVPGLLTDA